MINVVITGLYNRGQQDEYIELEAAGRCSLDGITYSFSWNLDTPIWDGENVLQSLSQAAVEGRFNVIGERGEAILVRIDAAPEEA